MSEDATQHVDVAELYARFAPFVLRRVLRFFPRDEAEQVVHEVCVKVLEHASAFRAQASPTTWLYRLTTSHCIDRVRDQGRRRELWEQHGSSELEDLITRDGELSELALMRHEIGELNADDTAFVERRLAASLPDRRQAEALRAFVVDNPVAPPKGMAAERSSLPGGWWKSWRGLGLAAIAAAVLVLVLHPAQPGLGQTVGEMPGQEESRGAPARPGAGDMRAKGREFDLRVQLEDAGHTRYAEPGGVVHPGEQVQFSISPRRAGYVMVVGIGPDGEVYPAHPAEPGSAVVVEAASAQIQLAGALAFDDVLGLERFVGIWCPAGFSYDDVATVLAGTSASLPHFRDGCIQTWISLDKRERGDPGIDPTDPDAPGAFDPLGNVLDDEEPPRPPDTAADDSDEDDGHEPEDDGSAPAVPAPGVRPQ